MKFDLEDEEKAAQALLEEFEIEAACAECGQLMGNWRKYTGAWSISGWISGPKPSGPRKPRRNRSR